MGKESEMVLKTTLAADENLNMSDLSNLLGDVYSSIDPDGPSVRVEPSASQRSAFDWAADDSMKESAMPAIDDDLAAALSAALVEKKPEPAYLPEPVSVPVAAAPAPPAFTPTMPTVSAPASVLQGMWQPGDDDIFPGGRKRK